MTCNDVDTFSENRGWKGACSGGEEGIGGISVVKAVWWRCCWWWLGGGGAMESSLPSGVDFDIQTTRIGMPWQLAESQKGAGVVAPGHVVHPQPLHLARHKVLRHCSAIVCFNITLTTVNMAGASTTLADFFSYECW